MIVSTKGRYALRVMVYLALRGTGTHTPLKEIAEEAFVGSMAEIVVVPEGVQRIGSRAFADCPNLYKVILSDSDVEIADDAFEDSHYAKVYYSKDSNN